MGTGFEMWTDEKTWFWCLSDPHRNRGATGAAATEAEAEREARWSIEDWSIEEMSPKGRLR